MTRQGPWLHIPMIRHCPFVTPWSSLQQLTHCCLEINNMIICNVVHNWPLWWTWLFHPKHHKRVSSPQIVITWSPDHVGLLVCWSPPHLCPWSVYLTIVPYVPKDSRLNLIHDTNTPTWSSIPIRIRLSFSANHCFASFTILSENTQNNNYDDNDDDDVANDVIEVDRWYRMLSSYSSLLSYFFFSVWSWCALLVCGEFLWLWKEWEVSRSVWLKIK